MDTVPSVAIREDEEFWITPDIIAPNRPEVTVVIPAYNAAATLERAVRSVLRQSLRDVEVIVVDDASRDESWAAIEEMLIEDGRIRGIRNKTNQGKPVGMNRAIALARGRWLAVLDADDWFEPDRLHTLVTLGERLGVDLVADNQHFHDARAGRMVGTAWAAAGREWRLGFDDFLAGSDTFETFNLGMLKPVLRLNFIRRSGLIYEPRARNGQDFLYLLQFFLLGGTAAVTDQALYCYTQPFGAVSRKWSHGARRRYDFLTTYAINQYYLDQAQGILTPFQAASLNHRNRCLRCLDHYYRIKERLAARDGAGALRLALDEPWVLSYLLRSLSRRYLGRSGSAVVERITARARRRPA